MPRGKKKVVPILGADVLSDEQYYLNNQNLPKGSSTYTWTPEMVQEIEKCRNDIVYFAEHYFFINGINGKEIINLFKRQKDILETIQSNKKTLLITSRQYGKCVPDRCRLDIRYKPLGISFSISIGNFFRFKRFMNKLLSWSLFLKKKN